MSYQYVLYEKQDAIARITLNRPEKLNSIDFPGQGGINDDLYAALAEAADDDDIKVVILRGAGSSFCSGHDLSTVGFIYGYGTGESGERRPSQRVRLKVDREWMERHMKLMLHPKITIAQVQGHCIGEGTIMAEFCDIAVAAEDAQISHAEQRLGFAGGGLNMLPLYHSVGLKRARELLLTGRTLSGIEAADMGLFSKAVPADKLEEEVNRYAQEASLLPADGIAIGKASHQWILDILGVTQGLTQGYLTHTLFTNLRFEEGEHNFFKARRDKGVRAGFHERDDRYDGLGV